MTKREAKQHKAEWQQALLEGRILRLGDTFKSYLTRDAATDELARLHALGFKVTRVSVTP